MAEIPVERKSGFPWLAALLGLLAVGALLWFLTSLGDDDAALTTYDRTAVNGAVDMDDLRVTRLTGDMSFIAEDANGNDYFIVFDEVPTPGTAKEGLLDINVGNIVDVEGTLRDRGFALPATVRATIPSDRSTFVYATDIEKED